ncbi:MAG: hypothetical protein ACC663_02035 [Gammaproteobacteria bacterium]
MKSTALEIRVIPLPMFGFGFSVVPLYDILWEKYRRAAHRK